MLDLVLFENMEWEGMYFIPEIDYYDMGDCIVMLNLLTGACEIISSEVMKNLKHRDINSLSEYLPILKTRGYIFDTKEQYDDYISAVNRKLEIQDFYQAPNFLLIPSYSCNLACEYCFERNYKKVSSTRSVDWINQFIFIHDVIKETPFYKLPEYSAKKINITLMGGEPFLPENHGSIELMVRFFKENGFSYNAITNGVSVCDYFAIFDDYQPESIQITLDGTKEKHNSRRVFPNHAGTFDEIVQSIHRLIEKKIKTYIRFNLDSDNADNLVEFSKFILDEFSDSEYCIPYLGGSNE